MSDIIIGALIGAGTATRIPVIEKMAEFEVKRRS